MKRYLLTFVIAVVCLSAILCLSACGADATTTDNQECKHTEETVTGKAATCTEAGLTDGKKCSKCGEILAEQEIINALGHTEEDVPAVEPTCLKDGYTAGKKCSVCQAVILEQTVIPAPGHTEITLEAVSATCKETGLTEGKKCSVCQTVTVHQQKTPIGEHNYVKGECTVCQKNVGEGLIFTLNPDMVSYSVTGIGTYSPKDVIIPEIYKSYPVTSIGVRAFYECKDITSVTIPESITAIGDEAFMNCYKLSELTIGKAVVSIGEKAFSGCRSLTMVAIPDKVTSIGNYAFSGCTNLVSFTVGRLVNSIGADTFSSCPKLVEVYNLSSLDVSSYFFVEKVIRTSLTDASILTVSGDFIFMTYNSEYYLMCYTGSSTEITLPDSFNENDYYIFSYAFAYDKDIVKVTLSNGVIGIGVGALEGCESLTDFTFGSNATNVGSSAFYGCAALTNVNAPSLESWLNISFGNYSANPISYSGKLYINGSLLTELTTPNTVTEIKSYAFWNCDSLTKVTISDTVSHIGYAAFGSCSSIESLTTPFIGATIDDTENGIIGYIFGTDYGAGHELNVPSTLKTVTVTKATFIADNAFNGCIHIESVNLPSTLTSIGKLAFAKCNALTSVSIGVTDGWYATINPQATSGTAVDVTNSEANAQELRITFNCWKRNA